MTCVFVFQDVYSDDEAGPSSSGSNDDDSDISSDDEKTKPITHKMRRQKTDAEARLEPKFYELKPGQQFSMKGDKSQKKVKTNK